MSKTTLPDEPKALNAARQWVNRNAAMMLVLCVAAMGLSVMILRAAQSPGNLAPTHEWFFDSVTGELIAQPVGTIPLANEGGNELWRAHVYACGDCDGETFVGYYTRYTAEARQRMERFREARQRWAETRDPERDADQRPFDDGGARSGDRRRLGPGPSRGGGGDGTFGGRFGGYGGYDDDEDGGMRSLEFSTDGITWTPASYERLDDLQAEFESRCPQHDLRQCVPPREQ